MKKISLVFSFIFIFSFTASGQDEKVKFSVVSRALQENNKLGDLDTLNLDRKNQGRVIVDLGIKANPIKKTEVQAVLRMGSDLGSLFGGTTISIRRLYLKGLIGNAIGYEVGDLYLQLSPYTFYNASPEGVVNEATIFSNLRSDIVNYENFYFGNSWWQQGAHVDGALGFSSKIFNKVKGDVFVVRNRTAPTHRFQLGSRLAFTNEDKSLLAFNFVDIFDPSSINTTSVTTSNKVFSGQFSHALKFSDIGFTIYGESGYSWLGFAQATDTAVVRVSLPADYKDAFFTGGVKAKINKFGFKAHYRYVGPDFRSAGAQTKRIDFTSSPSAFIATGNDPYSVRALNIFDLTRDNAVYNRSVTPVLMSYDPRLGNALPYGDATPNVKGLTLSAEYKDSLNIFYSELTAHLLSDVAGYGSNYKRKFNVIRLSAGFNLNNLIEFKKQISIYGGLQHEGTKRDGEISGLTLNSILVDGGLDVEMLKNFFLIGGIKLLSSKGNEFVLTPGEYNTYSAAPLRLDINNSEQLYAAGLKYAYSQDMYITAQCHFLKFNDNLSTRDYSINQFLIMFFIRL